MRRQQKGPEVNPATFEPKLRTDRVPARRRPSLCRSRHRRLQEAAVEPGTGEDDPCPDEEISAVERHGWLRFQV
jgi:hypothetical protein